MERALVTRRVLARELALNAATRPFNIALPTGMVVAALLLSAWLLPIALVVYAALVVTTLLDGDVAETVGREVYSKRHVARAALRTREWNDAGVARKLAVAYHAEQRIRQAIAESPLALVDLEAELERLMQELEKLASQADRVSTYLRGEDEPELRRRLERLRAASGDQQIDRANAQAAAALEDQLDAQAQLSRQLSRLDAQMEHIAATLGAIHAQVIRTSVAEAAFAQWRVAEQVRELRREVGAAANALDEVYRELD
jgi:predicted  nucleic acid-binding Zn-ribbon protein